MHRENKRKWWQVLLLRPARCSCGLAWPCLEVKLEQIRRWLDVKSPAPGWAVATQAYPQVGRAETFTPARAQRANGGCWPGSMNTQRASAGGKR
jgi:hypothetical protein